MNLRREKIIETAGRSSRFRLLSLLALCLVFLPIVTEARTRNDRDQSRRASAEPILRVKLGGLHKKLTVRFPEGGQVLKGSRRIKTLRRNEKFDWAVSANGKKKRRVAHNGETLLLQGTKAIVELNGKLYRGVLQISFSADGALIVNHVGIEDYLRGVVGSEIGSRSPAESIKAQTVIARTYAYASRGKHKAEGADVCDSTHCQVYSGVSAERDTIDPAVAGTRGIVMISDGEPIATLYHATCGGMTSDNDKVYGGAPRSYLRRVQCPFCGAGINYRWSRSIGIEKLKSALRQEKISFNRLWGVSIESPGHLDRVTNLVLNTDRGVVKVKGTTIRRLFDLPSTTFVLADRKLPAKTFVAARPAAPALPVARPTRFVSELQTRNEHLPQQILVMTAAGLKRAQKPGGGWRVMTLAAGPEAPFPGEENSAVQLPAIQRRGPLASIELFGRGYGHQVGLCQSGAIELGKRECSYRQILAHYYSNVALRSLDY